MCRLLFCNSADIQVDDILAIVDRAMLIGAGEGNHHGWGVSLPEGVVKEGRSYIYQNATWSHLARYFNSVVPIMGHVRAASLGTAITDEEAQPFEFDNFVGMHNGTFYRSWKDNQVPLDAPHSDTYRVFHRLDRMLSGGTGINNDVIEEWLAGYDRQSSFAIILKEQKEYNRGGKIGVEEDYYILRNRRRVLYYSTLGKGIFVTTSLNVLQNIANWSANNLGIKFGKMEQLEDGFLYKISGKTMFARSLDFSCMPIYKKARLNISGVRI